MYDSYLVILLQDTDGTGRLDFREFLASLSVQLKGTMEDKLAWLFNLYDLDNTGHIQRKELEQMVMVSTVEHFSKSSFMQSNYSNNIINTKKIL